MRSFVSCTLIALVFASGAMAAFKPEARQVAANRIVDAVLAQDWAAVRDAASGLTDADGRDRSAWILRQVEYLEARSVKDAELDVPSLATGLEVGIPLHNLMIVTRELGAAGWRKLAPLAERAYRAGIASGDSDLTIQSCHAGLLIELGRRAEAAFVPPSSPEDMDPIDVINVAYYHAVSGDRARTLAWLRYAMAADPVETQTWAGMSDDLNAFRSDPEFAFVFAETPIRLNAP